MSSAYHKLFDLLISGRESNKGLCGHLDWKLFLSEVSSVRNPASLASLHESLHYSLNNSTAYGNLLMVFAYLARETNNDKYSKILISLTNNCRQVHEIYATYTSLLAIQSSGYQGFEEDTFYQDYPDYERYVIQAESLLPERTSRLFKMLALESLVKACLQNPNFYNSCLPDIDQFSVSKMRYKEYPDSRLRALRGLLTQDYWSQFLDKLLAMDCELFSGKLASVLMLDDFRFTSISDRDYQCLSDGLSSQLDTFFKLAFTCVGQECLVSEEHLNYLDKLLEATNRVYPFEYAKIPLISNTAKTSLADDLENFARETLYLSECSPILVVHKLSSIDKKDWPNLAIEDNQQTHYFLVSRTVESIFDQYEISKQDRETLCHLEDDFLVGIRTRSHDINRTVVNLYLVDKPDQLLELNSSASIRIFSNISMVLMATKRWSSKWGDTVEKYSEKTVLMDLSPFKHIQRTLLSQYETVNLYLVSLKPEIVTLTFLCERGNKRTIFLAPCSELMAKAIVFFMEYYDVWDSVSQNPEKFDSHKQDINLVLKHLLEEEKFFNFNALQSRFARKEFNDGGFY